MPSKPKTTATKEEVKPALVPKLRFPEFRGREGWPQSELGRSATILKGKGISKADLDPNGSQPCIRYGELYTRYGETISEAVSRTNVPVSELFLSKPDDVIIPSSGETKIDIAKASCVLAGGIALGGDLNVIRSKLNSTFLSYFLNGPKRFEIAKVAQGDTVVHLYPHQLEALQIATPSPAEQQKIAECLSSVDEVIAAQARKLDALKTHKNGLMQQLFPREGETQPRLRFPEFQNAGEWEPTTIGALGNFYYGKSAPKWSLSEDAPTPCVRYGELYTKFGPVITETYSRTNIDPDTLRFSKGGEILIPRVGEKPEDFGKCCCYLPLKGIAIGEMISVLETKQHPLFYTYYFRNLHKQFAKVVEGQNVKNLYYVELQPLPIRRPSIPEQERIASWLSSLDALIAAETQKHAALQRHKRGLMQQLFPAAELNQ